MERRYDHIINPDARVDWKAALEAGLLAGAVLWLLSHGLPWFTSGMISPTLLGRDLKPAGLVDHARSSLTTVTLFGISICYTLIIAPLVTHFRALWAIGVGALVGLGLYFLNYLVFNYVIPVDWTGSEVPVLVAHLVFAPIAAAAYKGLASRSVRRTGIEQPLP